MTAESFAAGLAFATPIVAAMAPGIGGAYAILCAALGWRTMARLSLLFGAVYLIGGML